MQLSNNPVITMLSIMMRMGYLVFFPSCVQWQLWLPRRISVLMLAGGMSVRSRDNAKIE